MWNGAADALKPSPEMIMASPKRNSVSWERFAAAIPAKSRCPLSPYTSADPNRSTAEPKLPTIRYFRPASRLPTRSRSIAQRTECVGDDAGGVRATDVQCDGEAESDRVAEGAEGGGGSPARRARDEHGAQECERQRDEERVHRCEREPVDVRALDHGFPFASGP